MLAELKLTNFRCFKDHVVPFRGNTIVVGRNNAGKSTIVEALRLVSIVTERYQNLTFRSPPEELGLPLAEIGVTPSLDKIAISFEGLFHQYGEPPAKITAKFDSGETLVIYLRGDKRMHAVIRNNLGKIISTKAQALKAHLPRISILPQVGPLLREERILSQDYVRGAMSSNLSSLHFRNQLWINPEQREAFRKLAEESWSGLRIKDLTGERGLPGDVLNLLVQDGDFVAEVSWMGHGLQMWLQTMWFLARTAKDTTVILDEPDVYMHPDLQRRLIRLLRREFKQTIVATHSIEIMSEVDPENVLIVDRRQDKSRFANSQPAVQQIVDHVGSAHNLQLARLWGARRCLLVEGEDISLLRVFYSKILTDSGGSLDDIPNMPIGGWNGWSYAIGSAMLLKNAAGEAIIPYCLLDSDYHVAEQLQLRYADAKHKGVRLHIWRKKEIENYLLVPSAIARVIASRLTKGSPPSSDEVQSVIEQFASERRNEVLENYTESYLALNKAGGAKQALKQGRKYLEEREAADGMASLVSGKELLSALSAWSKGEFGASFGAPAILKELHAIEVDGEVAAVLRAIEASKPLGP